MRIGVALGSGAARGLAHIPYIEALGELGLTPSIIAGSSIGALIGSGWANGMRGTELREHASGEQAAMIGKIQHPVGCQEAGARRVSRRHGRVPASTARAAPA